MRLALILLLAVSPWACRERVEGPIVIVDDGESGGDEFHADGGDECGDHDCGDHGDYGGYGDHGDYGDTTVGDDTGPSCIVHDRQSCDSNDIYWFDSCDVREDRVEDCGDDSYSTNYCSSNDVYRDHVEKWCAAATCESSETPELVEDCGVDGYSANYCYSGDLHRDQIDRGCTAGGCFSSNTRQLVENCDCSCSGSSCINRVSAYKTGNNGGVTCDSYCSNSAWDAAGPRGDCIHAWETGVEVQRDCQHTLTYVGHLLCWCKCYCEFC